MIWKLKFRKLTVIYIYFFTAIVLVGICLSIDLENARWVATLLSGIFVGTIALFHPRIWNYFTQPKLDIVLYLAPPDCNYTPIRDPFKREELIPIRDTSEREELTTPAYYFRFRIYNHGESLAKDVEVVVEELWVKREDTGYFMKDEAFLPMNLVWTHMRSMLSSDSAVVIRQNIQPYGVFKFCDLCYIVKERPWLFFDFFLESFAHPNFVVAATYKTKVVASASNSKPTQRWFQIQWTGKWTVGEEEMFTKNHIIIEPGTSER